MKPTLVTGASGFLGWHVARLLIERGHKVRALVRPSSQHSRVGCGAGYRRSARSRFSGTRGGGLRPGVPCGRRLPALGSRRERTLPLERGRHTQYIAGRASMRAWTASFTPVLSAASACLRGGRRQRRLSGHACRYEGRIQALEVSGRARCAGIRGCRFAGSNCESHGAYRRS